MTQRYLVVFAKGEDNYSGYAPDVPGCVSVGDTLDEMRSMMLEALTAHFELMAEDGETAPALLTTSVDFPADYFDDVEYFLVQQMDVPVPQNVDATRRIPRQHDAVAA